MLYLLPYLLLLSRTFAYNIRRECNCEDGPIINYLPLDAFTFSSTHDSCNNDPRYSSIDGWCSSGPSQSGGGAYVGGYIQVDLGNVYEISAVGIRSRSDGVYDFLGGDDGQWFTSFDLEYSLDGITWSEDGINNTLTGNTQYDKEQKNEIEPFTARFLRYTCQSASTGYYGHCSARVEAYGKYSEDDNGEFRESSNINLWFNQYKDVFIAFSFTFNVFIMVAIITWFVIRWSVNMSNESKYSKVKVVDYNESETDTN